MKLNALLVVSIAVVALSSCTPKAQSTHTVHTNRAQVGVPVDIVVEAGPKWTHSFRVAGLLPVNAPPQLALWSESTTGEYLDTLYVTEKFGKQTFRDADSVPTETFRIEALPVWLHRFAGSGQTTPSRSVPLPDDVTGATPPGSFTVHTVLPSGHDTVRIVLEVNVAFDANTAFPSGAPEDHPGYNGVSGQPSLVYVGTVRPHEPGSYPLKLAGRGHPSGADGAVYSDTSTISSAADLISSCSVVIR